MNPEAAVNVEFKTPAGFVAAQVPTDESDRLEALRRLNLLDSSPSDSFDAVTRLAAQALRVPIVLVSLVDADRQWFKSKVGLETCETGRDVSFCAHAVYERHPLVVRDATSDPRFAGNPLVTGAPHIRAYLGIPLYTRERFPIGTLCCIDQQARAFGDAEIAAVSDFAKIVEVFLHAKELAVKTEGVLQYAMERERLFRETFEQAAVGIVHASLKGEVLRINQRACDMLGYSATELRSLTILGVTHENDTAQNVREFRRTLTGEIDSYRIEQRFRRKDGQYLWAYLSVALKRLPSGQPDYSIVVIEDISARKQAEAALMQARDSLQEQVAEQTKKLQESHDALVASNAKLAADSVTDYLTGLPNRRIFSSRSEQAARNFVTSRATYGLILMDLDNFKHINDEYGHDVGDEVLRATGVILLRQMRGSTDLAARLGGEEFAVLCTGELEEDSLRTVAERIRAQIIKTSFNTAKGTLRFTSSFGIALSQSDDEDWRSVYGRADAALYEAKAAGKDRVVFGDVYSRGATARMKALCAEPSALD
jgi:diguanylate cyclase (GGDEF)-like protein/PAS domain S-box-containing protein